MELKLQQIMSEEYRVLDALYESLLEQNKYLLSREVFSLDKIVKVIEAKSRDVANLEIERRKITKDRSMREVIKEFKDKELENSYNTIVELLDKLKFQKDTNEMLIKQSLGFTNQMLRAINPGVGAKTYNAFGKSR